MPNDNEEIRQRVAQLREDLKRLSAQRNKTEQEELELENIKSLLRMYGG